jgi:hypothetical protein
MKRTVSDCEINFTVSEVDFREECTGIAQNFIFQHSQKMNEETSPTFDRRVSPLVGAATQESNVWVLSVKGRKKEKYIAYHLVLEHI